MDEQLLEGMRQAADAAMQRTVLPKEYLAVEFYYDAMLNDRKTREAGRPIYENVECVQIRSPGESDILRRPATEQDKKRFQDRYDLFKRNESQDALDGFPLKMWPQVNEAQRKELAHFGVRSVEQLANMSEVALQRMGPYQSLRQRAKDWLVAAKDSSVLVKLRSENDDLRNRLAALEQMVAIQSKEIAASREERGPAMVLPDAPDRMAALEAKLAAITSQMTRPNGVEAPSVPQDASPQVLPRRRGRPPGSKNKPKPPVGS